MGGLRVCIFHTALSNLYPKLAKCVEICQSVLQFVALPADFRDRALIERCDPQLVFYTTEIADRWLI
jgi:hypothetical protein